MKSKNSRIQSYVFDKRHFTKYRIKKYLGFKKIPKVLKYTRTYRVIIIKRNKFKRNSFRTRKINTGVKVIKGVLR